MKSPMKGNMLKAILEKCADHCAGESEHHSTMEKLCEEDSPLQKSHAGRKTAWADLSKTCSEWADKCGKADADELGKLADEIMPSAITGIYGADAPAEAFNRTDVIPVLRPGMRPLPMSTDETVRKILGMVE